jgi:hypothetical protein
VVRTTSAPTSSKVRGFQDDTKPRQATIVVGCGDNVYPLSSSSLRIQKDYDFAYVALQCLLCVVGLCKRVQATMVGFPVGLLNIKFIRSEKRFTPKGQNGQNEQDGTMTLLKRDGGRNCVLIVIRLAARFARSPLWRVEHKSLRRHTDSTQNTAHSMH